MRSFGREIYNKDLSLDDVLEQNIRLKDDIDIFIESTKPKESFPKRKQGKGLTSISDCLAKVSNRKVFHDKQNINS